MGGHLICARSYPESFQDKFKQPMALNVANTPRTEVQVTEETIPLEAKMSEVGPRGAVAVTFQVAAEVEEIPIAVEEAEEAAAAAVSLTAEEVVEVIQTDPPAVVERPTRLLAIGMLASVSNGS